MFGLLQGNPMIVCLHLILCFTSCPVLSVQPRSGLNCMQPVPNTRDIPKTLCT